jgi:hypothetical protein
MDHQATHHCWEKKKVSKVGQRHGRENVCGTIGESLLRYRQKIGREGTNERGIQFCGERVSFFSKANFNLIFSFSTS